MTTTLAELDKLEAEAEAARQASAAADRRLKDAEFRYGEAIKLARHNGQPPPKVVVDLRRVRNEAHAAMNALAGRQSVTQIELVRPYWNPTAERWASVGEDKAEIVSLARQLRVAEDEAGMSAEAVARLERYRVMAGGAPLTPASDPSHVASRLYWRLRDARDYVADCKADARLRAKLDMPARKAA